MYQHKGNHCMYFVNSKNRNNAGPTKLVITLENKVFQFFFLHENNFKKDSDHSYDA